MRIVSLVKAMADVRRGRPSPPRFLTYIVTWNCNARCIMCDCWKKESPEDLSLEEVDRIFAQLPRLDAVRLTGGEPFVRADLRAIAEITLRRLRPLFLHVTTNGFLTPRIVEFCETRPRELPLRLLVSLDGTREKHNHVRGRGIAWDTAFATVKALAPRQRELNLELSVNQTIVDADGPAEYRRLREVLKPLGVRLQVVMAYDVSATYSLTEELDAAPSIAGQFSTFGRLTPEQTAELLDEVERDAAAFPFAERVSKRYYTRGIRNRLLGGKGSPNPPCVALNAHLRLYPDGDMPTCQFNSRRVGNLRRQSFDEVWGGDLIQRQRAWVRQCPGCWAECEVLPNAIYSGDLLRALVR
ncbi:MAG: radical SAM protein [Verrucomicrobiales bacterium]|nr:radical SAM protein [Verrucomicrobiales bacterium]